MVQVENLKHTLLDKLISVDDLSLLNKINDLINTVDLNKSVFTISEKQHDMLAKSEDDITNGKLITNHKLNLEEDKWLKA